MAILGPSHHHADWKPAQQGCFAILHVTSAWPTVLLIVLMPCRGVLRVILTAAAAEMQSNLTKSEIAD
jgi:hypothetical protein